MIGAGLMRRAILYLTILAGVLVLSWVALIEVIVPKMDEQISLCSDESAPQYITDEVKRKEVCD